MGIINTLLFIAKRLYYGIFHSKNLFYATDLFDYDPNEELINKEMEILEKKSFEELTDAEKVELRNYGGKELLVLFKKRLEKGYRLFLPYLSGEVVGASWIYEGGAGKFFHIPLLKKEFIILSVFTLDKFRRKGVGLTSLIYILKKMKQEGFHRCFISTKEWNFYKKTIKKAGFKFVGKFHEVKIFKRNILIWSFIKDRELI